MPDPLNMCRHVCEVTVFNTWAEDCPSLEGEEGGGETTIAAEWWNSCLTDELSKTTPGHPLQKEKQNTQPNKKQPKQHALHL